MARKASANARSIMALEARIEFLTKSMSEKISDILDDPSAHVFCQAGDGLVVAYRGGYGNSGVPYPYTLLDEYLLMEKEELLAALNRRAI